METKGNESYFTVQNYAKEFGVSRPTVYKMIKDKEVIKVIISGKTFVKRKEVISV